MEKYNALSVQGWLLLRYAHDDIIGKPFEMIDQIRKALELRGYTERDIEYLGPSEREILYLIAAGFNSAEAAQRLGKTDTAIRRRVQSICEKLVVRTRAAAVARALTWKLMDPEKIPFPEEQVVPLADP
jgi:DNA-binding CsgD family transcriptional regulator